MLNELKRPSLDVTLEVDIPKIQPIKHDLDKVEKFVTELDLFYRDAIDNAIANFDLDIKVVKAERTKVRKVLKTIEDNRKAMVKAFKEPIKDFEETSKRIEKILKGTDGMMKELVDEDKAMKEDPFGEKDIPKKFVINVECTEKEYADIVKYIEKKGVKVN